MQRHVQVHVHVHVYMYEHKQNMHGTCTQIHKTECCLYNKQFPPPVSNPQGAFDLNLSLASQNSRKFQPVWYQSNLPPTLPYSVSSRHYRDKGEILQCS